MPIPSPKCQIYPVAGETAIKNIVDDTLFTGTGTPTLVDEGAEKAWSIAAGTLLEQAIPAKTIDGTVVGNGVAIAIRFKLTANGTESFMPLVGVKTSAGTVADNSVTITRNGASAYRGRANAGLAASATSKANNVIHTLVYKPAIDQPGLDVGKIWWNTVDRADSTPNAVSTGANFGVLALAKAYINCQSGAAFTLLDFAYFDVEPTDADCAAIADNYRAVMPAPSGGSDVDPPTFTAAPAASAIGQTSATITATINETGSIFWVAVPQGDATPSVAQVIAGQNAAGGAPIDAGSAVATTSLSDVASGFTASTAYKFCVVAQDDEPTPNVQAAVTVVNFTTASAGDTTPPVFTVAPAVTSVSQTTATVSATIDETGSIFWVVVPDTESTPSVAQVIAGQNAAGGAPTDAGSAVGTTTLSEAVAGMTASTAYKACFVAQDDEGVPNVQATVTTVGFTTAAVPTGTITLTDLSSNAGVLWSSQSGITVDVYDPSSGALVVRKTGLTSTAGGDLDVSDAAIVAGTSYNVFITIGSAIGAVKVTAA